MDKQYVGVDLHRRRSVIVRRNAAEGETLDVAPGRQRRPPWPSRRRSWPPPGRTPRSSSRRRHGWYWAVDMLEQLGCQHHLAYPSGNNWGNRRVKNDTRDAEDLADLLRLGVWPRGLHRPAQVACATRAVRYRAKLVAIRTGLKAQV